MFASSVISTSCLTEAPPFMKASSGPNTPEASLVDHRQLEGVAGLSPGCSRVSASQDNEQRRARHDVASGERLPARPRRRLHDMARSSRTRSDGDSENGQHHGRRDRGDGHFALLTHAAEAPPGRVRQGEKETPEGQQTDDRESAPNRLNGACTVTTGTIKPTSTGQNTT